MESRIFLYIEASSGRLQHITRRSFITYNGIFMGPGYDAIDGSGGEGKKILIVGGMGDNNLFIKRMINKLTKRTKRSCIFFFLCVVK